MADYVICRSPQCQTTAGCICGATGNYGIKPTPVPADSERMTAEVTCNASVDTALEALQRIAAWPEPPLGRENWCIQAMKQFAHLSADRLRALSPQPDRAKADEPTLAAIRRRANNYSPSHGVIPTMSDVIDLLSLYDTLSARAEAAEARAETARADGFRDGLEWARQLAGTWAVQYLLDEEPSQEKSDLLNEVVEAIEKQMHPRPAPMAEGER